jgi:signal transduction histidine kinase
VRPKLPCCGFICVFDCAPKHHLPPERVRLLEDIAAMVVDEIEVRRAARQIAASAAERKRIEAALKEAKEAAERASRAKSEFLSRMSHELRTPLNAVLGFAQLLEIELIEPEQTDAVSHILKGGRHLLNLIDEVLDIARIESGRLRLSVEPVGVLDVFEETLDLLRPLIGARSVAIRPGLRDRKDCYVLADRQKLKQILLNLVSNAIKYTRQGDEVWLAYHAVGAGRIRLSVQDTGPGIPLEKRDRLFVPFDRLGAEQTEVEGFGLGLVLSKRLTESLAARWTLPVSRAREPPFFSIWRRLPPMR